MARIKFVLNERRLAWVEATKLQRVANAQEAAVNTKVSTPAESSAAATSATKSTESTASA
jgi:hypothetical protein